MKNGFTLIELLAVIVILAIILLIATPIVLDIIKDSKDSAMLRSADNYLDAVSFSVANKVLDGEKIENGTYNIIDKGNICLQYNEEETCINMLEVKTEGEVPTSGTVTIENGKIKDIELVMNNKTIIKNDKGQLIYNLFSLKHEGVIPKGGTYYVGVTSTTLGDYTGATATYKTGDAFPEVVNDGDVYVYGDYEYRYNYYYYYYISSSNYWSKSSSQNGWGVRVLDTAKEEYGDILEGINKIRISSLDGTFAGCYSIINSPMLPETILSMKSSFNGCSSLEEAPLIPSGVTNLESTFKGCSSLKTYKGSEDEDGDFSNYILPNSLTNMYYTFRDCRILVKAPVIPSNVTNMSNTFCGCNELVEAPIIPEKVTLLENTFTGCYKLCTYKGSQDEEGDFSNYVIPSGVTTMQSTFNSCSLLITSPVIPSNVTNMSNTFRSCYKLKGVIEINANPTSYSYCFTNTTGAITLTGTSTMLETLADGYNNVTVATE